MARDKVLTPKEKVYARTVAATGDARYALDKAGYAPSTRPAMLDNRPAVAEAIINHRRAGLRRMEEEGLPLALDVTMETLADPNLPAKDKAPYVKMVFNLTIGARQDTQNGKDAVDMTPAEVNARIAELRAAQTMRAIADATIEGEARPVEGGSVFD